MKFTAFGFMQISLIELLRSALVMLVVLVNRESSSTRQRWKNVQTVQTRLCYFSPWLC